MSTISAHTIQSVPSTVSGLLSNVSCNISEIVTGSQFFLLFVSSALIGGAPHFRQIPSRKGNYATRFLNLFAKYYTVLTVIGLLSLRSIRDNFLQSAVVDLILPERSVSTQQPRWWEQLPIHRKEEEYVDGHDEVRHLWRTQVISFLVWDTSQSWIFCHFHL